MSAIEPVSMSGTEVSEKPPVDFGTKAVSLKSQSDSGRILQSSSQIRNAPVQANTRPSLGVNASIPMLGSMPSQKTAPAHASSMTSRSTPGRSSTASISSAPSASANFAPGIRTSSPSPMQQPSWTSSNVITVPRCISPSTTVSRTSAVSSRSAVSASKTAPQQTHRASDAPRPLLVHTAPQKPATQTQGTQLHITTDKTIKVPSITQVLPLRPPYSTSSGYIGQNQGTAILQTGVSTNAVLTAPVRLNVSGSSQPPLLPTQRVAMPAVSPATVLASRITVPSGPPGTAQAVAVSGPARIPSAISQGTVIAASSRIASSGAVSQSNVIPAQTRLVPGQNTILAAPARIGAQIVPGQPAVLTATARIASAGTTVLSTSKPATQTAIMATSRMPVSAASNHQPATRIVTTTTASNLPRTFTVSTSNISTRTTAQQIITATTTARLTTAPSQPTGIVVHPQIVVNTTKTVHGSNHMTAGRPVQIHSANSGPKVISQPLHAPIQITQSPVNTATSKAASQSTPQTQVQSAVTTTVASKQICYTPTTSVATRPVAVVASQSIPIAKIFPQNSGTATSVGENEVNASQAIQQQSSVYIQAANRTLSSPGLVCTSSSLPATNAPTLSTYTLPGGASYIYEAPSGYQLATDAPLVARPLSPDTPLVPRQLSSEGPLIARPFTPGTGTFVQTSSAAGIIGSSQHMRINPVMIVDPASVAVQSSFSTENSALMIGESPLSSVSKLTASPRPSILRKRDNEASPAKASKNLTPLLSSASVSRSASPSPPSLHVDTNQQSNDHGPSSNGSTTISATSSPEPDDTVENAMPAIKTEFIEDSDRPPVEMSPRKKPRKQLLNDANDAIEMEFISDDRIKKEKEDASSAEKIYLVKRPNVSLLHSYKHTWKSRHNHFLRYTDVKPKDERRPTVTDLANQKQVLQKVNGWKIYHLSTQMEDLSEMESHVLDRLSTMLQAMDRTLGKDLEKDVNRVNDLIMGNIQRSKVIKDQMQEAKTQMMKVFDHKVHVSEIISRCASKRNFKKRDKY